MCRFADDIVYNVYILNVKSSHDVNPFSGSLLLSDAFLFFILFFLWVVPPLRLREQELNQEYFSRPRIRSVRHTLNIRWYSTRAGSRQGYLS